MITLDEFLTRLQRKLDDEAEEVWTRNFLRGIAQEGYDRICRGSGCIFDVQMFDDQPLAGTHTRDSDAEYMDTPIMARFNFTRESDREFVTEGATGPANHTRRSDAETMTDTDHPPTTRTLGRLTSRFVSVDRVTHDWLRLEPDHDRYFRATHDNYDSRQGGVWSYSMDQDGIFNLRTVGIPVREISPVEISGVYGAIRVLDDSFGFASEPIVGEYGVIRSIPRQFASGSQYGVMKSIVSDDKHTRVELFRLGAPLTEAPFEVPDRIVRYIEWYAMHRAYSEPGQGENKELAGHFRQRFEYGLEVLRRRVNDVMRERTAAMGSKRLTRRDNYLEMFPADFGYKRPFRG